MHYTVTNLDVIDCFVGMGGCRGHDTAKYELVQRIRMCCDCFELYMLLCRLRERWERAEVSDL